VEYHDPFIPHLRTHENVEMESVTDIMDAVRQADCVVIITNHSEYDYQAILKHAKFIFDSRNALGKLGKNNPKVVRL
jgi:UDP-N-acetyl-D-glucosamine dehydrogenase